MPLACTHTAPPRPATATPTKAAWEYEVRASGPDARELAVEGRFAVGASDVLRIDDAATPFVRDVEYDSGQRWTPAIVRGPTWTAPCHRIGCRVRYRFALREAATKIDDAETAIASGDVVVAPPSTWLLHPDGPAGRLRFHVSSVLPGRFAAGTHAASGSPDGVRDTFEVTTDALAEASFAVFGPFHEAVVRRGAARIDIAIAPRGLALTDADVVSWVSSAVDAIASYYGRFPVDHTLVVVQAHQGSDSTRGETLGEGGPAVLVSPSEHATAASLRDDWVMTHELLHVTLPSLPHQERWLSEGIPTYVEPIARARVGLVAPEKLWRDLVEGIPQGLPRAGDEGLERTHTWGRTYWGGALYCLLADVMIREQTGNRRALDDAIRAVSSTGADVEAHWEVARFIEIGDRATGTHVLGDLYRDMALAPGTVDLAALWNRLGVHVVDGSRVVLDNAAPLALVRQAITAAPAQP
ncbi:MAG: hypothetical protein M3O46_18925 [Myxococcota bacterium]|nr:hypothetical protein [Myxococcota bacterium]